MTSQLMEQMLMPIKTPNENTKFKKVCRMLEGFDEGKHWFIIPDIDSSRYIMINVMIDNNSDNYITKVLYYDSLERPATRAITKNTINLRIKEFIANLVGAFNKFSLNLKKCSCNLKGVHQNIVQTSCPVENGIDCGLFAVMICLYIFNRVPIDQSIFSQQHITSLRNILPSVLVEKATSNRILSNVQKSFWSCTQVNSC